MAGQVGRRTAEVDERGVLRSFWRNCIACLVLRGLGFRDVWGLVFRGLGVCRGIDPNNREAHGQETGQCDGYRCYVVVYRG